MVIGNLGKPGQKAVGNLRIIAASSITGLKNLRTAEAVTKAGSLRIVIMVRKIELTGSLKTVVVTVVVTD